MLKFGLKLSVMSYERKNIFNEKNFKLQKY